METSTGKILHLTLASYRVGREIERYKKEREEEMRKQQGGMTRAPSIIYTTGGWGRCCKQTDVPPGVEVMDFRYI
jgi:hypothetical protein